MMSHIYNCIVAIIYLGVIWGCVPQLQQPTRTLVVTDYVRASDMAVPDMPETIQAANAGEPTAQNHLGSLYYRGLGVPKKHKLAEHWWKLSAASGYPEAQYNLGMLYFHGSGIKTDFVEGCKWLGMAAAQGHPDAVAAYQTKCRD